jgi:hypothetical protein
MLKLRLVLVYAITELSLPAQSLLSQTSDEAELTRSLQRTLSQSLHESLSKAVDHVTTRAVCINVLEAKVSEEVKQLNPKFIMTCSSIDNTTLNLSIGKVIFKTTSAVAPIKTKKKSRFFQSPSSSPLS